MIIFNPLWETMEDCGVSQYSLINTHNMSRGQISRFRANGFVSTHTVNELCSILHCRIEDIIKYIPDEEPSDVPCNPRARADAAPAKKPAGAAGNPA